MNTIDIIIPVYNEIQTLEQIIKKIENSDFCGLQKRIILVDDYSTDGTREFVKKFKNCSVFFHDKNLGKGAALRTGIQKSNADIIVFQDADLEYNPSDYKKILPSLIDNKAAVVYGSRLKDINNEKNFLKSSLFANKFLTFLTNVLYGCKLTDVETCYKAFRKDVIKGINIKSNKFEVEIEITTKLIKKGYKIKEIPISYNGRDFHQGKKITIFDGMHAVFALFYYRFFN